MAAKGKKVVQVVKLQVPAGSANPAPPVGPVLSGAGVNIMEFCKNFNDKTKEFEKGLPLPVVISVYSDKSFTFILKKPPVSYFIKKVVGLDKGSSNPGHEEASKKMTMAQAKEIAELKIEDLNSNDIDGAIKIVLGSARSMGVAIDE